MVKVKSVSISQSSLLLLYTFCHSFHNLIYTSVKLIVSDGCFMLVAIYWVFFKMHNQDPKHQILHRHATDLVSKVFNYFKQMSFTVLLSHKKTLLMHVVLVSGQSN